MSTLAAIVTAYGERGARNLPAIGMALWSQTRRADFTMTVVEDIDLDWAYDAMNRPGEDGMVIEMPTPRDAAGRYEVIPYSQKINVALHVTDADYIVYVTDDSLPHPEKFERMAAALDEHPEWGVVYCGQRRNGRDYPADREVPDAYCLIDHSQVMHRRSEDRWPLDVAHMRLGDAVFWRALHARFGPFYPVPGILDVVEQTPDGISATW